MPYLPPRRGVAAVAALAINRRARPRRHGKPRRRHPYSDFQRRGRRIVGHRSQYRGHAHLVSGQFAVDDPLQIRASSPNGTGRAFAPLSASANSPLTVDNWAAVANDTVMIALRNTSPRRRRSARAPSAKTLTFTLSTAIPRPNAAGAPRQRARPA